jgi:(p)ppGpp synthase/HD superfamily hydrolase
MHFSPLLERALRFAADAHRDQTRKGSDVPYITHPVQVAWILSRTGWNDECLLAAALLHDVLEDCGVEVRELRELFPDSVVETVVAVSERKFDQQGRKRSWEDRKRDHLDEMGGASLNARALTLADKLHNLETIAIDLATGVDVWTRFNAPRERLVWYYSEIIARAAGNEPSLEGLVAACRNALQRVSDASGGAEFLDSELSE